MEDESLVNVAVPASTKAGALEVLDHWGISLKDAITIYLQKIIECREIPFDLKDEGLDWDDPTILHPKTDKDGAVLVPRDWLDEDE